MIDREHRYRFVRCKNRRERETKRERERRDERKRAKERERERERVQPHKKKASIVADIKIKSSYRCLFETH